MGVMVRDWKQKIEAFTARFFYPNPSGSFHCG
jgi:hypothetical protein